MSKSFAALLTGGAILVSSLPSAALAAPRADRDARAATRAAIPAATVKARGAEARRLGPSATVASQPGTGALHLLQRTDGMLTGPSSKDPKTIALDYVRAHADVFGLGARDLAALDLAQDTRSPDGLTHLRWTQSVDGIPVYDTDLTAHLDSDGRLASFSGDPLPGLTLDTTSPTLSAQDARAQAATYAGGSTTGAGTPQLVAFPLGGAARLAWDVTAAGESPYLYDVVVDATSGELLRRRNLTEFANNAQVWGRFPGAPGGGGVANPVDLSAWLTNTADGTQLAGPNAHVYSDVDGSDSASAGEEIAASSGTTWSFTASPFATPIGETCPASGGCTWDPNSASSYTTNRRQDGTQVFYFVNAFHDHLAAAPIGFTSASGAFEGGDRLNAEPDDAIARPAELGGPAYNNANMATPADGQSPRMQMYLFKQPFNAINGGDAADVVYHEYTHGLSNRLVRDLDGIEGAAMGEGWSDWYALDFLNTQGYAPDNAGTPGELDLGQPYTGGGHLLRHEAIDCTVGASSGACPGSASAGTGGFTYGDVGNVFSTNAFEPHGDGEVWGQTLWDLRTSLGTNVAETLVTGGMRLSPRAPSFLNERDAILQEDVAAYGGVHVAAIWSVFAARGMGYAASPGTQDFSLPPHFDNGRASIDDGPGLGDGDGALEPGESARLTVTARNLGAAASNTAAVLATANSSVVSVTQPSTTFSPSPWPTGATATSQAATTVSVPSSTSCGTLLPLSFNVAGAAFDPHVTVGPRGPVADAATGTTGAIAESGGTPSGPLPKMTTFTATVPDVGYGYVSGAQVALDISHSYDADLILSLTHAGRTATLVNSRGDSGDNFTSTVFSDAASTDIGSASAPFSGTFRPETPLSAFDGTEASGTWTLRAYDQFPQDAGTLNSWSIRLASRTCSGGTGGGGGGGGGGTTTTTTPTTPTVPAPVESGTNPAAPIESGSNPATVDPSLTPPPLDPRISLLKAAKALRLARNRSFTYTFAARPGATGTATFVTTKAVAPRRGAARKKVVLKVVKWVASTRGVVTVHAVLTPANAKLVKTLKAVPVTVVVASGAKKVSGALRLLKPR